MGWFWGGRNNLKSRRVTWSEMEIKWSCDEDRTILHFTQSHWIWIFKLQYSFKLTNDPYFCISIFIFVFLESILLKNCSYKLCKILYYIVHWLYIGDPVHFFNCTLLVRDIAYREWESVYKGSEIWRWFCNRSLNNCTNGRKFLSA